MQISGFSTLPVVPSQNQRPDIAERQQKDVQRETNRNENKSSASTVEQLQTDSEGIQQRNVESSNRSSEVISRRQAEDQDLPLSTRRALQIFAANTPTPEQQLGIELAGIDTFA
ncbi:MAG: hypothetical protein V3T17_18750 [Pseudomonadales bacterium]